jgi:hypothetical protein
LNDVVEIVGEIPQVLRRQLEQFDTALATHTWGGSSGRLVVTSDLGAALREWMPIREQHP